MKNEGCEHAQQTGNNNSRKDHCRHAAAAAIVGILRLAGQHVLFPRRGFLTDTLFPLRSLCEKFHIVRLQNQEMNPLLLRLASID